MRRNTDRPPVTAQELAHRRAPTGASEKLIFFFGGFVHRRSSNPSHHEAHEGHEGFRYSNFLASCSSRPSWLRLYHAGSIVVVVPPHCAKIFFIRSTTSGGWTITFFAIASNSCPVTGSTSQFLFCASDLNSGSLSAFINASRSIAKRSAGRPGGAINGRPIESGDISTTAKRRVTSDAFRLSKISLTVGTSGKRGSRLGLPCTNTRVTPLLYQLRVGSLPKYPSRLPARHCTSPFCIARSISAAPG